MGVYVMSKLQFRSAEFWRIISKTLLDHFGVDTLPAPKRVNIISPWHAIRIGGQYQAETAELQVTQEVIENEIPLQGIIYRECLYHALPTDFCDEAKHDIASCFARSLLGKSDREKWIAHWKTLPPRRIRANLVYDSFETMDWMYKLGGYDELVTLIHEFESMDRYGKKLTFEEYFEYIIRRTQDIIVGLSQTEVKIIDTLQKDTDISYRQVSKNTGLSESWVSTKINQLKDRYVLVNLTTTPFSKIGIRTFHVLLAGPSWDDPTRFIKDCPFLYDIRPILSGPWHVISRLAVPDHRDNIKALDQMVTIMQRNGIAVDVTETYSVGVTNSFYHYNTRSRQWDIPWVAMESWGHRIQAEFLHQLVERIDYPAKTTDHYLDPIDMEILELAHKGIASTRTLRKKLSIGQTKLSNRVRKLRAEELIRKVWAVYNIGLVERVALRVTDKETSRMLDAWSRELPRGYLRYEENRNLLLMIELPSGGSTKLMDVLRKLKWPVTISPIGSGVWGQWDFPKHLWDIDKQRWTSPRPKVISWLNKLVIECEDTDDTSIDTRRHFLQTR
ncbi:MAG: winged helix-turn-helix domain-containing protein [Candidatus Thorarchaeota archaeon]|nr:MAG: winged helix-turn-helix domain-containing protein [Candidatus Thorarchaeota archaeon]